MADLDFLDEQALAAIFAANNLKPTTNHTLGEWAAGMRAALPKFGVDNPRRVAAFLGQTLLESGGFRHLEENLHYSSQGLQKTFRLSEEEANAIAGDPEKIANKVYGEGHRAQGLGNTQAGDGYLYRGRGLIQLTGRSNYEQCSAALFKQGLTPAEDTITRNPDLLMTDASRALRGANAARVSPVNRSSRSQSTCAVTVMVRAAQSYCMLRSALTAAYSPLNR